MNLADVENVASFKEKFSFLTQALFEEHRQPSSSPSPSEVNQEEKVIQEEKVKEATPPPSTESVTSSSSPSFLYFSISGKDAKISSDSCRRSI